MLSNTLAFEKTLSGSNFGSKYYLMKLIANKNNKPISNSNLTGFT